MQSYRALGARTVTFYIAALAVIALGVMAAAAARSQDLLYQSPTTQLDQRTGSVFRGMMTGGIWLELADNEQGRVELAILDGLPRGTPETRFIALQPDTSTGACRLISDDASVSVSPCRPRGGPVEVNLAGTSDAVAFREVSWAGSFAWGGAALSVAEARTSCLMLGMQRIESIKDTPLGRSLANLRKSVNALPAKTSDLAVAIDELRVARLDAYATLEFTPQEKAVSDRVDLAVKGRTPDGRPVSLKEATLLRQQFKREIADAPRRVAARKTLTSIDGQLAEIYDPVEGVRQTRLRSRIRDQLLPELQNNVIDLLANRQPEKVIELLQLEGAAADLERCAKAVSMPDAIAMREVVQTAIQYRVPEVEQLVTRSVETAQDSTTARQVLNMFESNPGLKRALGASNNSAIFTSARKHIAKLVKLEQDAIQAGRVAAAKLAAQDAIPPTTSRGRFSAARVARSVVFVWNRDAGGAGSGFIVAPGVVLTNMHVTQGRSTVYIVPDGKDLADPKNRFLGRVVREYPNHDMAVIKADGLPGRALEFSRQEPERGQEVWAMGYPGKADDFRLKSDKSLVIASFTRGNVMRLFQGPTPTTGKSPNPRATRIVQYDALTEKGSSGGAILDSCHRIVAIHHTGLRDTDIKQGTAGNLLPALLRENGVSPKVSGARCS